MFYLYAVFSPFIVVVLDSGANIVTEMRWRGRAFSISGLSEPERSARRWHNFSDYVTRKTKIDVCLVYETRFILFLHALISAIWTLFLRSVPL